MSPADAHAMSRAPDSVAGKEKTWMDGAAAFHNPRSPTARDRGQPPASSWFGKRIGTGATCLMVEGYLEVFFSQHRTCGVARVYVDLDGFALVRICPHRSILFAAKTALVVAHLLFGIAVDMAS